MPDNTPNYNLIKPLEDESFDVDVLNENSDTIDEELWKGENSLVTLQGQVEKALERFIVRVTFHEDLLGEPFTIEGGGFSHTDDVPEGLTVDVSVPYANTSYVVQCLSGMKIVKTTEFYGIYEAFVKAISPVLSENTWEQIETVANSGDAEEYWNIGDEIDIELDTEEVLTLQIYGFGHDEIAGGGNAGITFGLKNLMDNIQVMNWSSTSANGFTGSYLYSWLNNDLLCSLPEDLQAAIKVAVKKTADSSGLHTEPMKIFLFSEIECFASRPYSFYGEGYPYQIFTDNNSRSKKLSNGAGQPAEWWERSPYSDFCCVNQIGGANYKAANAMLGVCFGFCV